MHLGEHLTSRCPAWTGAKPLVEEECRTSNLPPAQAVACRGEAFADSLSGLSGANGIIGGRSLVHSDSTYLMAQLIGYTPW